LYLEEDGKERQRAKKETKKVWTNNFRVDLYRKHLVGEHHTAWQNYQTCSHEEKKEFFATTTSHKNTMLQHVQHSEKPFKFIINASIIDTLICDMFFHPEDHSRIAQTATGKLFQSNGEAY